MTRFQAALAFTLTWEGGYVNHPADPGGATNYGITQRTYDNYRRRLGLDERPVKQIDAEEVSAIYHRDYWLAAGCDQHPPAFAAALFDATVHSGPGNSLRWAHEAAGDWRRLNTIRLRFLTDLSTWPVFGRGWTRRIADLFDAAAIEEAEDQAQRSLTVLDENGNETTWLPIPHDLLIRVTPAKIYARPDNQGGTAQ